MRRISFFGLLVGLLLGVSVAAQDEPIILETPPAQSLDLRLFRSVYNYEEPVFSATMRGVNIASYPAFFVAIPAAGLIDFAVDGDFGTASRMAASEVATMGVVFGLKNLIRRQRPYAALPDVDRRPANGDQIPGGLDPFSFPSGHSAISFAVATSLSLSHPEWYVVIPSMTWASATALARVWHGMHFPSDIAVGAVVGTSVGILVHVLLAPDDNEIDIENLVNVPPTFSFTIPL